MTTRDSTASIHTALGVAMCLILCAPAASIQAGTPDNMPLRTQRSLSERDVLRVLLAQVEDAARQMHRHSLGWQSVQIAAIATHPGQVIARTPNAQPIWHRESVFDRSCRVPVHLHNLPPPTRR